MNTWNRAAASASCSRGRMDCGHARAGAAAPDESCGAAAGCREVRGSRASRRQDRHGRRCAAEAEAIAVIGDTIAAVGSNQEIQPYIGPDTRVIELNGALAVPGLIDAHVHFTGVGQAARNLKLAHRKELGRHRPDGRRGGEEGEAGRMDPGARLAPGEMVARRPRRTLKAFPVHDALSKVSPQNPVWLTHASGHAGFANAKAMESAGVTKATPDPKGGQILKDAKGEPTGLFNERAQSIIGDALARDRAKRTRAQVEADLRKEIELASQREPVEGADHGERRRIAAGHDRADEEGRRRAQAARCASG